MASSFCQHHHNPRPESEISSDGSDYKMDTFDVSHKSFGAI